MAGGIIGHTLYKGRSSSVPINGYGKDRTKIRLHCLFCAYLINAQVWHVFINEDDTVLPVSYKQWRSKSVRGVCTGRHPKGRHFGREITATVANNRNNPQHW